jgi:hypothetical protein
MVGSSVFKLCGTCQGCFDADRVIHRLSLGGVISSTIPTPWYPLRVLDFSRQTASVTHLTVEQMATLAARALAWLF